MRHRNRGAPFHRADGSVVERGEEFEPTPEELRLFRYKLRPVSDEARGAPATAESVTAPAPAPSQAAVPPAGWPMAMHPELYLRLHPAGPHARLAREVLGIPEPVEETTRSSAEALSV